ncbi:MAG TPA: MFS transporter [Fimbriimonadales bacterium]|nr:MFS transporter [Fimbriimonadales bacterium]
MNVTNQQKIKAIWLRPQVAPLLALALLCELGVAILNVAVMPVYLRDLRGFSEGVVGLVVMSFLLSEAFFKSFMGHYTDKYGKKFFLISAPMIWSITPILTLLIPMGYGVTETLAIAGLRVLDGLSAAMLWPAAYASVAEAVGPRERAHALSLLNVCFMIGLALGLPIAGGLNGLFDNPGAGLFAASFLFVLAALIAVFFHPKSSRSHVDVAEEYRIKDIWLCCKKIPLLLITAFVTFLGVGFPMVPLQWFAKDELNLTQAEFGGLALPAGILMALASVPLGSWGERIGKEKAVQLGLGMCSIGIWLVALGAWIPFLQTQIVLSLGAVLVGLGFLLAIPSWYATVSHIHPKRSASYLGAVMTAQGLGAIIGLVIGSKMYEFNHYAPFVACGNAVTLGFFLSFFALDRLEKRT